MSEGKSAATPQPVRRIGERRSGVPQILAGPNAVTNPQFRRSGMDRRVGSVAAPKAQPDAPRREGWMDSIDFEHEVGHANGGNVVYPTKENLHENRKCLDTDGECTAMRVYVFDADKFDAACAPKAGEPPQEQEDLKQKLALSLDVALMELRSIDAILERRPALAGCKARTEKVELAISAARETGRTPAKVREARRWMLGAVWLLMRMGASSKVAARGRRDGPAERPYGPDPNASYLCVYCNKKARLRDAEVVVDCYQNVVHIECLPLGAGVIVNEKVDKRSDRG